ITYVVDDGNGSTDTATVTVDVVAVNDAAVIASSIIVSTVYLNKLHDVDVTVTYSFSALGEVIESNTVTIEAGNISAIITLSDSKLVSDETLTLSIDDVTSGAIISRPEASIAIHDIVENDTSTVNPTSDNVFQISDAQVIWNDYDPDANNGAGQDIQNYVTLSTTDSAVTLDTGADSFNLQNLLNAANNTGDFKTPTLSIELLKLPTVEGIQSGTITINLIDNEDGNIVFDQGAWSADGSLDGDRKVQLEVDFEWTSDGETAEIILTEQSVTVTGTLHDGEQITKTISNLGSDAISITSIGPGYPATLDLKFAALIDKLEESLGSISILQEGNFYLTVDMVGLPLADSAGNVITSINSEISITDGSPLSVFIADASVYKDSAVISLTETNDILTTSGVLTSADVDNPDNTFITSTSISAYGELNIDAAGVWSYTTNANVESLTKGEIVIDTFTITSIDGTQANIDITITGTNDVLVANSDTATTNEDTSVIIDVLINDTDL
ncbi:MAG TPA: hypothetical protein EYO79_05710, partial [Candidatus Marinimicrobia bacterium]|nr:hypothetical protein [Candidatus Neomarinimicrobiota bacterium]